MEASNTTVVQIVTRLENLENRQIFQEVSLEDLNKIIIKQAAEISRLQYQLQAIAKKLAETPANTPFEDDAETPPHY